MIRIKVSYHTKIRLKVKSKVGTRFGLTMSKGQILNGIEIISYV